MMLTNLLVYPVGVTEFLGLRPRRAVQDTQGVILARADGSHGTRHVYLSGTSGRCSGGSGSLHSRRVVPCGLNIGGSNRLFYRAVSAEGCYTETGPGGARTVYVG